MNIPLHSLCSGRHPDALSGEDPFFMDRDPHVFRSILLYLREKKDGKLVTDLEELNVAPTDHKQLLAEAQYFGISGLVELVETHLQEQDRPKQDADRVPLETVQQFYMQDKKNFSGMNLSGYSFRGWDLSGMSEYVCFVVM